MIFLIMVKIKCTENVSIISTVNRIILGIYLSILWLPLFMHSDTI